MKVLITAIQIPQLCGETKNHNNNYHEPQLIAKKEILNSTKIK